VVPDRATRVLLAYMIALNVFGLVVALTLVVGTLLHMANAVGFAGLLVGITLAALARWRTERALERRLQ
jgi:uncharacterized membrane protein